ncbi:MAG TPA: cytochrome P450 [Acidimicrobiales bacterium]|jgi:cytochrome P450 family 142 subfamily A polypeptide 1|nr:cytochrome P450 [Acidimicrobiales bacterium]
MTTIDAPAINLLDPQFYIDPNESYRWLREHSPVHWDPVQQIWGISRYQDVVDIEKDTTRYSSWWGSRPRLDQRDDTSMINKDDPDHQRQRMLVARQFTPRAVKQIETHVRGVVTELLDAVVQLGTCEAVDAIASRLPAIVIGDKLGYPRELWTKVRDWSEITMFYSGQTPADGSPPGRLPETEAAIGDFAAHTMQIIAARRAEPRDDLISLWANSEVDGRRWTDAEILSECILLLDGGAETTRTVIGSIIRQLALEPEQRDILLARPAVLGETAVEEFIRWVSPILNMRRTVTEDHELHGQPLHAGDQVLLMYASANRDERVFRDPERFEVTRAHNHHVAFGFGTHFCLGASLARLELRVTFEELLRRIPDWRLVPGTEPKILPATFTRAYDAVHIEFTPERPY